MGTGSSHCILTLLDRRSGFTLIRKLKARTMAEATREAAAVIQRMRHKFHTITFDNGTEFHGYEGKLQRRFGVTCYFATPYHSWERGANENLNGLVRQYLPRDSVSGTSRKTSATLLPKPSNPRPRKRLGFKTPTEIFTLRPRGCCTCSLNLSSSGRVGSGLRERGRCRRLRG